MNGHDTRARFCTERQPGEWVPGIRCLVCEPLTGPVHGIRR